MAKIEFVKAYSSVRDDVVEVLSANSDVPYRATLAEAVAEFPYIDEDHPRYFKSDDKANAGPHPGRLWIYRIEAAEPFYSAQFDGEAVATAASEARDGSVAAKEAAEAAAQLAQDESARLGDYPTSPEDIPISTAQQAALDVQQAASGANVLYEGAVGNGSAPDRPAFQLLLDSHKAKIDALEAGSPDAVNPRGVPIHLADGKRYTVNAPLVVSKYTKLGGSFPTTANGEGVMINYTGTDPFLTLPSSGLSYGGLNNVMVRGRASCDVDFCTPDTSAHGFIFSRLEGMGFTYWKPIRTLLVGATVRDCDFRNMPLGCLYAGASDTVVERNFVNAVPVAGVAGTSAHTFAIEYQGFHNSRHLNNYITGSDAGASPRPCCLRVANSHDSEFTGDWYDLSDGPALRVEQSYNCRWSGGKINYAAMNPPTTDEAGSAVGSRYTCAVLISQSYNLVFDGMEFKNISTAVPTFNVISMTTNGLPNGTPRPGKITIRNSIMDAATTAGEVRVVSGDNTCRAYPIWCDEYEHKPRAVGGAEMPVAASSFTPPPVMRMKLTVPPSAGAAIATLQHFAVPGRRIEITNLGTNTVGINILTATNPLTGVADVIRGQAGMTKLRQAGQPGKACTIECVEAGVWDFVGNSTVTYVA